MARKRVPNPNLELLRNWLRDAVRVSGLPAYKLAAKAGIAQTTLTRFLNGHTTHAPTWDTILKIANAANFDPPDLSPPNDLASSRALADSATRNLLREAIKLADKVLTNDPDRALLLPDYAFNIFDLLHDLQRANALDRSAIIAIELTYKQAELAQEKKRKQAELAQEKERWAGNLFSPFPRDDETETQSNPRAADEPTDPDKRDAAPPDQPAHPLAA